VGRKTLTQSVSLAYVGLVAFSSLPSSGAEETEKFTFFWQADSLFSQWYGCKFTVDGVEYNCAEQYMMHQKARELVYFFIADFAPYGLQGGNAP